LKTLIEMNKIKSVNNNQFLNEEVSLIEETIIGDSENITIHEENHDKPIIKEE
jgi:hypothetical protein